MYDEIIIVITDRYSGIIHNPLGAPGFPEGEIPTCGEGEAINNLCLRVWWLRGGGRGGLWLIGTARDQAWDR